MLRACVKGGVRDGITERETKKEKIPKKQQNRDFHLARHVSARAKTVPQKTVSLASARA